jgi:hypothetical protein
VYFLKAVLMHEDLPGAARERYWRLVIPGDAPARVERATPGEAIDG